MSPHQHAWSHGSRKVCVYCGESPDGVAPPPEDPMALVALADLEWLLSVASGMVGTSGLVRIAEIAARAGLDFRPRP